jgi:hypothetical protein
LGFQLYKREELNGADRPWAHAGIAGLVQRSELTKAPKTKTFFFFKSENLRASLDVVLQETLSVIDFFSLVSDVFLQVVFC